MRLKKYRPAFFEGFKDEYFNVNTKEELLESDLCKGWLIMGYEICFLVDFNGCGSIMAIRQADNQKSAMWYVVSNVYDKKSVEALSQWLPNFYDLKKLTE